MWFQFYDFNVLLSSNCYATIGITDSFFPIINWQWIGTPHAFPGNNDPLFSWLTLIETYAEMHEHVDKNETSNLSTYDD